MVQVGQLRGSNPAYLQAQSNLSNMLANVYAQQQQNQRTDDTIQGLFRKQLVASAAPVVGGVLSRSANRKKAQDQLERDSNSASSLLDVIRTEQGIPEFTPLENQQLVTQGEDGSFQMGANKSSLTPREKAFNQMSQLVQQGKLGLDEVKDLLNYGNFTGDELLDFQDKEFNLGDKKARQPLELKGLKLDNDKKRANLLAKGGNARGIKLGGPLLDLSNQFAFENPDGSPVLTTKPITSALAQYNSLSTAGKNKVNNASLTIQRDALTGVQIMEEMEGILKSDDSLFRRFVEASTGGEKVTATGEVARLIALQKQLDSLGLRNAVAVLGAAQLSDKDAEAFTKVLPNRQDTLDVFKNKANLYKKTILQTGLDTTIFSRNASAYKNLMSLYQDRYGDYVVGGSIDKPLFSNTARGETPNSVSPAEGKTVFSDIDAEIAGIKERSKQRAERSKQRAEEIKQLKESLKRGLYD